MKAYRGAATLQSQTTSGSVFGMGRKANDLLRANEREAHRVAEFVRNKQLGFEAYVLHTEFSSYVTIGGFDAPNDPKLIQTAQHFLRELSRPGSGVNQLHLKTQFMTEPVPMPVPQVK